MFRILVVDDDIATRALLKRALTRQGYEVCEAADGREGVERARELQPALIICDWIMPHLDGLEVCRQIKRDPALATTFFILLTTRGATEDLVLGLDTGSDDFLSKPIEINELKARVRAGLRIHQLTRDLRSKNHTLEQLMQDLKTQKQVLESELSEAADYVRSLLPGTLDTNQVQIDNCFIPSSQLGGDCFDYYWLDPDYLAIYLLDVSGHGLGATLLSVAVMNVLRSQSLPGVNFYQPNHVLDALNETFQMNEQNDKYFTIWYGVYNQARRQLMYASAGHPPAVLIAPDPSASSHMPPKVQPLRIPGIPIGMLPNTHFSSERCKIDPSSILYIFSDGVYEAKTPDGKILGFNAFVDLLTETNLKTNNLDKLLDQVQTLTSKESLDDDLSLLQIRFN